jgi:hypothetical protein
LALKLDASATSDCQADLTDAALYFCLSNLQQAILIRIHTTAARIAQPEPNVTISNAAPLVMITYV